MKICDLTMFYNDHSGGIKTYIDAKRRHLLEATEHEHVLVMPGRRDRIRRSGRSTVVTIRGPLLPGQDAYRAFLSPAKIAQALMQEQPDLVELGSYYMEPWGAFSYRRHRREAGRSCVLGAYFHTDVADAYVASPLRSAAHAWLDDVSDALAKTAEKIADVAALRAERYIGYVFAHCDVALAASQAQAQRLAEYGVSEVRIAPLGVDVDLFHPGRRSAALRAHHGAGPADPVLIYAGRLCTEKRTPVLLEAFSRLPRGLGARLWLIGDGPLRGLVEEAGARNPAIRLLPYQNSRAQLAELLASADLYVTAGPFETFGLSVIEAQAAGLPVVGVDAGALRERVPTGLGLLGPTDDPAAMAENILSALRTRSDMGRRARTHAAEQFGWANAISRWLACYEPERGARPDPA